MNFRLLETAPSPTALVTTSSVGMMTERVPPGGSGRRQEAAASIFGAPVPVPLRFRGRPPRLRVAFSRQTLMEEGRAGPRRPGSTPAVRWDGWAPADPSWSRGQVRVTVASYSLAIRPSEPFPTVRPETASPDVARPPWQRVGRDGPVCDGSPPRRAGPTGSPVGRPGPWGRLTLWRAS